MPSGRKLTTEEFIRRAIKIHGNKYDYSKVEYVIAKNKVVIICKEYGHGCFYQIPHVHLTGSGCPKCGLRIYSTEEYIKKAIAVHGDKYNYSKVEYKRNNEKIIIICKIHNKEQFLQSPSSHLRGAGCVKCGRKSCSEKKMFTIEEFIEKAIKVHGSKYDYSKVEYRGSREKIIIICKKHHEEFSITPNSHLQGQGCPKRGFEKRAESTRQTQDEFIEKAIKVHGNKYDYSKVNYINSYEFKVKIKCIYHNSFFYQLPKDHIQGSGCLLCGIEKRKEKRKSSLTFEKFLLRAKKIHGEDKYSYDKKDYKDTRFKIQIWCKEKGHGFFLQRVCSHLNGGGCPECGKIVATNKRRKTIEQFIKDAIKVHGNKYDYSKVKYKNAESKIMIICHKYGHGLFLQSAHSHLRGFGCPHCNNKNEGKVKVLLLKYFPEWEIIPGKKIWSTYKSYNHKRFCDFWLEKNGVKIIVEYDGYQHFQPVCWRSITKKQAQENLKNYQLKDSLDSQFCEENNIILYRIKYDENKEQSIKELKKKVS